VLSLGVVLALILVVVRARAEDNNRWLLIGVGVVLLLGAVFGLKPFLERVRAPNQDGTGEVRRAVWGETLRQTLKRPVIGVGPGNFTAAFNQEQRISRYYQYEHAEQGYLTVAYEFGLPFLLGSLALLGLAIWHAVQQRERAWRACLLTVLPLLVFLIHNFLDTLVRIPATLCVLALAVAFSRGFTGMTRMDIEKMSDRRPLLPIALALLVLFAAAYGTWMRGLHARTMANLDRGRLSVGVPLAGTFLKWSWDEFHALTEISMALQRQLEATGAVDPAAEELVLRCGDALAKRQPAGWQSWYLYGWSRLYAGTDPEQAIRGLRNAVTCLPRWNDNNTSTVTKVLSALGRYGGQTLLNGFYKQLNAAEREALWPPVYDHILLYPTATLTWAAALAPTGEDRARIIHEVFRRGQSQVLRNTLERIWSNDQLPEEDRLVAGRALAGTVKAEEFLAGFPLDLQSSLPATLLRVDRMIAVGRTNEAATRLAALVPDPTDVPPSQQREVAGVLLKLGDQQRAYDLCVSAAKRRTAVLAASQRQRTVRERFLAGDPALARETLTTAARRNPADAESALDLATFLVETQDPGAAIRVLDSLPAGATVDQKGEAFYLRSRVAEAAGDLGEAARQLMSLLAVTPVPINQPR
jgi:hypothetical protein